MFYLRYDDIEGLFREAAENYQINADKAFDWDKIQRNVHHKPGEKKKPEPEKNTKRKFIFWFLLLLLVGLFSYNIWSIETEKKLLQQNISKENKSAAKKNEDKITRFKQNENSNLKKQQVFNKRDSIENKSEQTIADVKPDNKRKEFVIENLKGDDHAITYDNTILSKETNADISPIPLLKGKILLNAQSQGIDKNLQSLIQPPGDTSFIQPSKNKSTKRNNGSKFYAGAFVAPDVTFIEFQQSNGVGTSVGLTVGYQVNKNWSIESGISFDTKKYYTKGEYFDKNNVPDFYNADLLSVNGRCNMFEVPLNIRYKFPGKSNHNFTAALGTSSYFMTKESYNYSMISWGRTVNGKVTNFPRSADLFAVINVSAGYEKKLNNLSLLIEPYFKLPVKGIGTGNLYMSSGGLSIGLKKYFGKK